MMKKKIDKKKILILGILFGMFIIFFLPIFPVPLPNKAGNFGGFMFISGLMQLVLSLRSFVSLELLGGTLGFAFSFFYIGVRK